MTLTVTAKNFKPIKNNVFVQELDSGIQKTFAGIIIPNQDTTPKARWGKVYAVGPEVDDLKPGEFCLIKHGRWSLGFIMDIEGEEKVKVWKVEYPDAIELVSEDDPRLALPVVF